ncbi:hypothetical protein C5167_017365 [Papaver somniferum]|uniref:Uncharacterized protein n=1 Tax=Papaver somniferum TaxID=3469 RepID=A0A4Y7IN83_PAPSO|nr:hypothetical protein C5167_017365 [Papaver somniferum]
MVTKMEGKQPPGLYQVRSWLRMEGQGCYEPVLRTHKPFPVELEPGILGNIFDKLEASYSLTVFFSDFVSCFFLI